MYKRMLASVLSLCLVAGMCSGCGNEGKNPSSAGKIGSTIGTSRAARVTVDQAEKPEKITMMVDGTLVGEENGRDVFEKNWEALTGVDLEIIQPAHETYYEEVTKVFDSGELPDVVLLSSTYYTKYAEDGMLADISDYYAGSELASAVDAAGNTEFIDGIRINDKLYGITPTRGNGCVTYIRTSWLEKCKLSAPATYEEYLDMLKAFSEKDPDGNGKKGDTYGVSAAGVINAEAPYVNYLPEFYQDAFPSFYQKEDGTWADGFEEEPMKDALKRLKQAYEAGYLDKSIVTNATSDCRDKFFAGEYGVFTYWAGNWAQTLSDGLKENGQDGRLTAILPLKETGDYLERVAPVWCITSACKNPAGVYKYFLETMLDGADVETAWTYAPDTEYGKNHIDHMLALVPIKDDPGESTVTDKMQEAADIFDSHSHMADLPCSTDAFAKYNEDLSALKADLINRVVTENLDIDKAYEEYVKKDGNMMSDAIVESLNAE